MAAQKREKPLELTCVVCGNSILSFYKKKRKFCSKSCTRLFYYRKNPQKYSEYNRLAKEAKPEHHKRLSKIRYARNREARLEDAKEFRKKHIERYRMHDKLYYQQNKERISQRNKESTRRQILRQPWIKLLDLARQRSKKKNREYNLSKEWASQRWTGKCELTGIEFAPPLDRRRGNRFLWPSIDRIDTDRGYTQDNCRFVLMCVNIFKHDGTDEDMFMVAEALVRNRNIMAPPDDHTSSV